MSKKAISFQKIASEHAEHKKQDATNRALLALEEMKAKGLVINFNSLANYANVSKAWLYRHPDIRQQVNAAREEYKTPKRTTDPAKILKRKEAEIETLKKKLAKLTCENKGLKQQLEVIYGELHNKDFK